MVFMWVVLFSDVEGSTFSTLIKNIFNYSKKSFRKSFHIMNYLQLYDFEKNENIQGVVLENNKCIFY